MKKQQQQSKPEKPDTTFRFSVVEEKGDEVIIEVSPEDYAREMAAGVLAEETLSPGRHKFIRGGFRKRHPNFDPKTAKISVGLYLHLDHDVLEYFKRLAEPPGASSVEAQINQALRQCMAQPLPASVTQELLSNADFIAAVAAQVRVFQQRKSTTRKKTPGAKLPDNLQS